jgi:uncharacterized protein DUF6636
LTWLAVAAAVVSFQSPSQNIGCVGTERYVRCDVAVKDWNPPKPAGCPTDYGQGAYVNRKASRGALVCAGDTALGSGNVLPYGKTRKLGNGLRCKSLRSGMRCTNRAGHGFKVARQAYKLF